MSAARADDKRARGCDAWCRGVATDNNLPAREQLAAFDELMVAAEAASGSEEVLELLKGSWQKAWSLTADGEQIVCDFVHGLCTERQAPKEPSPKNQPTHLALDVAGAHQELR